MDSNDNSPVFGFARTGSDYELTRRLFRPPQP